MGGNRATSGVNIVHQEPWAVPSSEGFEGLCKGNSTSGDANHLTKRGHPSPGELCEGCVILCTENVAFNLEVARTS